MFGKNVIATPYADRSGGTLKATELFYTLQGEGPDGGRPAIFLRLTHCNLRCYFCDTEFDQGQEVQLSNLVQDILIMSQQYRCSLLVVTGGEPLLQNIIPLVAAMNGHGIAVSVETAGTVCYEGLESWFSPVRAINDNLIVCSPKTPKVNPNLEKLVGAWKYIIKVDEEGVAGIPCTSTQIEGGKRVALFMSRDASVPIFLQAMDEQDEAKNAANVSLTAKLCMAYGYRMSVQVHKLAGLR